MIIRFNYFGFLPALKDRSLFLIQNRQSKIQNCLVIGKQIIRSATSVGANYRAACRAKSTADILHKLAIVEEEADETLYWLELLVEAEIFPESKLKSLMIETNEIVAMIVASIKTLKKRKNNQKSSRANST